MSEREETAHVKREMKEQLSMLRAFVDAFGHELMDAVLVRFGGVAVSLSPMELT